VALASLDDYFPDWKEREALAEAMIPIIGKLYRRNVVTYCYGQPLHNQSVLEIMQTHRFVRQVAHNELSEFESFPILEAMCLDSPPSPAHWRILPHGRQPFPDPCRGPISAG
jgi:hypothetical protein